MVTVKPKKSLPRRTVYVATAFALIAVVAGFGMAAFTITNGPALSGSGTYHGTAAIAWWTETDAGVGIQPAVLPATVSGVVTAPTVLAGAAANYGVNAAVANDVAQYWKFSEATTAALNTELELGFTVSTGAGPTVTTLTVFVETQAGAPGAAITFTFYYDLGSPAGGTITLNSVTEISQLCSAVGTCP